MPVYEYRCQDCHRRSSLFFMTYSAAEHARCPHCQSQNLNKLVSRVNSVKSEEARLESMSDPSSFGDVDENDPKSVARMMRKMGSEMGEDMGPEFSEMVDRLESGESPEEIEKSMPELGGGAEGGDLGGGMGGGMGGEFD